MKHNEKAQQRPLDVVSKDVKKRTSLSEQEILDLQRAFLQPGFQVVTVSDLKASREVLSHFLDTFGYFSLPAMLRSGSWRLPQGCTDLFHELVQVVRKNEAMEEYMADFFQYDFLAIEGSQDLLNASWFGKFEQILIAYGIAHKIPVVLYF